MNEKNLIFLAYSNSVHGIKGEFSVTLLNPESRLMEVGMFLYLKSKKTSIINKFEIQSIKYGNKVILKIKDIDSRNLSESLIPFEIYIESEYLPELLEDEFYIKDLIGLQVIDDETQESLGCVIGFYETSASLVLQISNTLVEFDVIFNKNFIREVDLENKKMKILRPIIEE